MSRLSRRPQNPLIRHKYVHLIPESANRKHSIAIFRSWNRSFFFDRKPERDASRPAVTHCLLLIPTRNSSQFLSARETLEARMQHPCHAVAIDLV